MTPHYQDDSHCQCGGLIAWTEYPGSGKREGSCYGECGAYFVQSIRGSND